MPLIKHHRKHHSGHKDHSNAIQDWTKLPRNYRSRADREDEEAAAAAAQKATAASPETVSESGSEKSSNNSNPSQQRRHHDDSYQRLHELLQNNRTPSRTFSSSRSSGSTLSSTGGLNGKDKLRLWRETRSQLNPDMWVKTYHSKSSRLGISKRSLDSLDNNAADQLTESSSSGSTHSGPVSRIE